MARNFQWTTRRIISTPALESGFEPIHDLPLAEGVTLERVVLHLTAKFPNAQTDAEITTVLQTLYAQAVEVTIGTGGAGPPPPEPIAIPGTNFGRDFLWTSAYQPTQQAAGFRTLAMPRSEALEIDTSVRRAARGDELIGVWFVWDINIANPVVEHGWFGWVSLLQSAPP